MLMKMTMTMTMTMTVTVMMSMVVVGVELNSHLLTGLPECYLQCGRTEKVLIAALLLPPISPPILFCNPVVIINRHPRYSLLDKVMSDPKLYKLLDAEQIWTWFLPPWLPYTWCRPLFNLRPD